MRRLFILLLLLAVSPARAERATPDAGPPAEAPPRARDTGSANLSQEDEELVQELALLEQLELVRNLELFEEDQPK